jgi:hypothetical protein
MKATIEIDCTPTRHDSAARREAAAASLMKDLENRMKDAADRM